MKKAILLTTAFGLLIGQFAFADQANNTVSADATQAALATGFTNANDQTSYALGVTLGQNMKKEGISLSNQMFIKGFNAGFSGQNVLLTDAQIKAAMLSFQKQLLSKVKAKQVKLAGDNETSGQKFLDANKTKTGIVSLPDGLQYKVLTAGTGNSPTKQDTVKVDYKASTIDGKVFDSSYKRGKPAVFKVSNMIRGFQEALLLMKTGATWQVYIPAELAYGARGVPGVIGPNQTLIFKIHLIDIEKASTTGNAAPSK